MQTNMQSPFAILVVTQKVDRKMPESTAEVHQESAEISCQVVLNATLRLFYAPLRNEIRVCFAAPDLWNRLITEYTVQFISRAVMHRLRLFFCVS